MGAVGKDRAGNLVRVLFPSTYDKVEPGELDGKLLRGKSGDSLRRSGLGGGFPVFSVRAQIGAPFF